MKISSELHFQTVITTYEVTPGTYLDLLDLLQSAFDNFISKQSGFIAGAIHTNDAQTRIANYTQWETREQFLNVLRAPQMRELNRQFSELSRSFEPVLYDVNSCYAAHRA